MIAMITLFITALALQPITHPVKDDIVVTARRAADQPTVQRFVNSITQRSSQQVARFHSEICPVVLGLAPAPALVIEERIRETALGIGAKVATGRRCDANIVLIVSDDGEALVRDLRANRPDWLEGLETWQVKRLLAEQSPARAWSVASLRNEDGMKMRASGRLRVMSASIINLPTRTDIEGSVIVLERKAVLGLSLAQIADYVAMRGLARTRPPSAGQVGTILGLFASGQGTPPQEMTGADIAYLQSLYRSSGRSDAVRERNRIAREMTRPD